MYSLILVIATGTVSAVGSYNSLADCQTDRAQFENTKSLTAACVRQQDPRVQIEQAQRLMFGLMQGFQSQ